LGVAADGLGSLVADAGCARCSLLSARLAARARSAAQRSAQ
jgi:hypothetical protein